jgi:hydrogenase maturation protease
VTEPILVAGIGNLFLTDDGFGPEVVRRLAGQAPVPGETRDTSTPVRVVDYGIRGMHLAYDVLDGCVALVIVDAFPTGEAPGVIAVLKVDQEDLGEGEFDAHGMNPVAVLANLERLGGSLPPTYVVGCQPADVSDGMGLTAEVAAAVDGAVTVVQNLVAELATAGKVQTRAGA